MPNSRQIAPEVWAHAYEALVEYFVHRGCGSRSEDLAQETLLRVLTREDYEFDQAEDFLKVCYGFARMVRLEGARAVAREPNGSELELSNATSGIDSTRAAEDKIFLDEICKLGQDKLDKEEWALIQKATEMARSDMAAEAGPEDTSNGIGVRLFRAREKLAQLAGVIRKKAPKKKAKKEEKKKSDKKSNES